MVAIVASVVVVIVVSVADDDDAVVRVSSKIGEFLMSLVCTQVIVMIKTRRIYVD